MVYDIYRDLPSQADKPGLIYRVNGNGSPMPREFATYADALRYVRSDEFAKECPIWTPMTVTLALFFVGVFAMMIAMGVH